MFSSSVCCNFSLIAASWLRVLFDVDPLHFEDERTDPSFPILESLPLCEGGLDSRGEAMEYLSGKDVATGVSLPPTTTGVSIPNL